jgi:GNAT superfamily N-acetyltransferase
MIAIPIIRNAVDQDLSALAMLMGELGYPVTAEVLSGRLQRLSPVVHTVVAEAGGTVAGFIGYCPFNNYESDTPICWIMALSVSQRFRRQGIGQALLAHVEEWCTRSGIRGMTVQSGEQRADAHTFYESCGFLHTGRRFKKALT